MIWIPIAWTEYTATLNGTILKLVPCEGCGIEYVYVLEREGEGFCNSYYLLNEIGAAEQAKQDAIENLESYLMHDFDPVPCPVCGHYQRYMFPKLYDGGPPLSQIAWLVLVVACCFDAVVCAYWIVLYLQGHSAHVLQRLALTGALLIPLGLALAVLNAAARSRVRCFDPNTEDQQTRIARGRSRAVTRAEFEAKRDREGRAASSQAESSVSTPEYLPQARFRESHRTSHRLLRAESVF
ncbi:hypothetical protein [Gemmata sp.]|uniref:hypothetical protein n=1 Tax=Gemmata sp. TaxID=1914242 RepID=UPI003F708FAA